MLIALKYIKNRQTESYNCPAIFCCKSLFNNDARRAALPHCGHSFALILYGRGLTNPVVILVVNKDTRDTFDVFERYADVSDIAVPDTVHVAGPFRPDCGFINVLLRLTRYL